MVNDVIEGFVFEPPIASDHPEREGTVCQIVERAESNNTLETGPAFWVRFGDGHEMEAYSAELRPYYAT
jgi:hypothetical protein